MPPAEMIARVVSWLIFGAALEWGQEPIRVSLGQMTEVILGVIMDGVAIPRKG